LSKKNFPHYWINKFSLLRHPEGGWFREVYRSDELISRQCLPERYSGDRNHSTSIYFLITREEFSAFHKLRSDEIWHFYYGSPLIIHTISDSGDYRKFTLGVDEFQITIRRALWFAAEVADKDSFSLTGCTVSPGFHFDDFILACREELISNFPQHKELIKRLTRD
jgi:predicted cupin superfamily sugar epimerase